MLQKLLSTNGWSMTIVLLLLVTCNLSTLIGQCPLVCTQNTQVTLNQNGEMFLSPELVTSSNISNCSALSITITDAQGAIVDNPVTCAQVNEMLSVQVKDLTTGNQCFATIHIKDYFPPQVHCDTVTVNCNFPTDIDSIGWPIATDNCTIMASNNLSATDDMTDWPCGKIILGDTVTAQIVRTWIATDDQQNTNSCAQLILVRQATLQEIVFPKHRDNIQMPALDCALDDPYDLTLTGQPMIDNRVVDLNGSCDMVVSHTDTESPICGASAKRIVREWKVIDLCTNQERKSFQQILIKDTTPPVITCPPMQTVSTHNSDCLATVQIKQATVTDDCTSVTQTISWPNGNSFGTYYEVPIGLHPITIKAKDDCGNESTCTTSVMVVDSLPPIAICDPSVLVNLNSNNQGFISVASFDQGSVDNCDIATREISIDNSGFAAQHNLDCSFIQYGAIPVELKITDLAGNVAYCTSQMTVREAQKPTAQCIARQTIQIDNELVSFTVPMLDAGSTDNCPVGMAYQVSPTQFTCDDLGEQVAILTVTDQSGNTAQCTGEVEVIRGPNGCQTTQVYTVEGSMKRYDGDPIENGKLIMSSDQGTRIAFTDAQGKFTFNEVPPGDNYVIRATVNTSDLNGLTTRDLLSVAKHLMGIEIFSAPELYLAADINIDKRISATDLSWSRKLILHIIDSIPNVELWTTYPADYIFTTPANAHIPPDSIVIGQVTADVSALDFRAIKRGDLNLSASPVGQRNNNNSKPTLTMQDRRVTAGERLTVPVHFSSTNRLEGFQFGFRFSSDMEDVEAYSNNEFIELITHIDADHSDTFIQWMDVSGKTWNGDTIMYISFSARNDGWLSDIIQESPRMTSEAVCEDNSWSNIDLILQPEQRAKTTASDSNNELKVWPNPASDYTYVTSRYDIERIVWLDVLGHIVATTIPIPIGQESTWQIKVPPKIPSGNYLLQCRYKDQPPQVSLIQVQR